MKLTTIHFRQDDTREKTTREAVYLIETEREAYRVRVVVRKDFYPAQSFGRLEQWNGTDWVQLFTANRTEAHRSQAWETEDGLLDSFGTWVGEPFHPAMTEAALLASGHLDDETGDYLAAQGRVAS